MGALIAMSMIGVASAGVAVKAEPPPEPVDIEPDPVHKKRQVSDKASRSVHKSGPALHNRPQAQISDARTDADRARIAAAIAKRERKARRSC